MNNTKNKTLKILVTISFLAMVIVNYLALMLPLNGLTQEQISDSMPNLFAPAGVTFSIWGLIYLALAAFVLHQFGLKKQDKEASVLNKIRLVFLVSSLANIAWIYMWHYDRIFLSAVMMLTLLISLIVINLTLDKAQLNKSEKVFYRLPFSMYFAWITVATIANITALLVRVGWDRFGWSEQLWTIIILLVGMGIGTAAMIARKDIAYGLVLIWAYTGILIKHFSESAFDGNYPVIIGVLIGSLVVYVAAVVYTIVKIKRTEPVRTE